MQLKGKTALISGGGRNMGKAIALTFAREGADVILLARTSDEVQSVARECEALGVRALPITADVGKTDDVNHAVRRGMERFGKIDILTCVAALRPHVDFWEHGYDEWLRVFAVNVHSTFYLAKAIVPAMIERGQGGNIIAMGSGSAMSPKPRGTLEAACKHSLYGFIKSLAVDLGPHGIRANLLVVGHMDTQRLNPEWYPTGMDEAGMNATVAKTPLRRAGKPEEAANAALFLASDQSSFITGDALLCTGGRPPAQR